MKRALLITLSFIGCGPAPEPTPMGDVFIAFQTTFDGYETWHSKQVEGHIQGITHLSGPRTVFIKELPPAGATEFPVGTVIAKEMNDGSQQVFAMVKRGGGYNASGALNWEWFELKRVEGGTVRIVWRGVGPPAGEKYAGDPNGACNGCHASQENDFVRSVLLDGGQ